MAYGKAKTLDLKFCTAFNTQIEELRRAAFCLCVASLAFLMASCSDFFDAATAIADDIESGIGAFNHSSGQTTTIVHTPTASRGGCADGYRVQFSAASALVVWCRAPGSTTESVSSHTTTYHLNYVDVPQTTIVDKEAGQPLTLDIAKGPGKPIVTGVR